MGVPSYTLGLDGVWHRPGYDDVASGAAPGGGTTPPVAPDYVVPTPSSVYKLWSAIKVGTEDLQHTLARMGAGQKLILPAGTFGDANTPPMLSNFKYGGHDGVRANGTTGVAASLPQTIGLMGQGPDQTIIRMDPNSNTFTQSIAEQGGAAGTPNFLFMVDFAHCDNGEFGGFTLQGDPQDNGGATSKYYNGMYVYNGTNVWLHHINFLGCGPGHASAPPGETFELDLDHFDNPLLEDLFFDGRQYGTLSSASNVGINTSSNGTLRRVTSQYAGFGTTFAFYQNDGVWNMVDCVSARSHSPQINLERQGYNNQGTGQVMNIVRHKWDSTVSAKHIAVGNDLGWSTINVYDPDLSLVPGGKINISIYDKYAGNNTVQTVSNHGVGTAINCWVGGVWDDVAMTYSGGTLRNDLFNVSNV